MSYPCADMIHFYSVGDVEVNVLSAAIWQVAGPLNNHGLKQKGLWGIFVIGQWWPVTEKEARRVIKLLERASVQEGEEWRYGSVEDTPG